MAKAQLVVLITEWLRRIPDFEVVPGWCPDFEAVARRVARRGEALRVRRLPLRWDPVGG
jgi:hypothetical protein